MGKFLYLFGADGKAFVIEPGAKEGKVVFTTDMEDKVTACPAFHAGRIYVRGQKYLFCLGRSDRKQKTLTHGSEME